MRKKDYLILGVVIIIFVGTLLFFIMQNRFIIDPLIRLGEIKSLTVGETLQATGLYHAHLGRIISNASGTFAVFSKDVDEDTIHMYIPVGSTFSIYTMTFKVVSIRISDNIVVVQRIS